MRRYEGYLRPSVKPAAWPARWVVVTATGTPQPVGGRERIRATGLKGWYACEVQMSGPTVKHVENSCGSDVSGLWRLLTVAAAKPGPTWCLSARALYDWTLLGLWERLQLGTVTIRPSRQRRNPTPGERGQGRETGILMAADPPSAALLLIGEEKYALTWVCARNYGWHPDRVPAGSADTVQYLVDAVRSASLLLDRHQLGGWCITPGAMAFRAWRARYLKGSIYVANDARTNCLADESGSGGRVLSVRRGSCVQRAYAVDARGLYPALCAHGRIPMRLRATYQGPTPAGNAVNGRPAQCIARVGIRCRHPIYPRRERGRTDYPVGDFLTTLAGPELERAVKYGHVTSVMEAQEHDTETVLADFARAAYAMRCDAEKTGQAPAAALAKALAVSLVGKLAQRVQTWEECEADYADPWWGEWWGSNADGTAVRYRSLAGAVSRLRTGGLAPFAVPLMASWIWSAGRVWLWERMAVAGLKEVLYADTDGMIVTERGYGRLCDNDYIRDNEWGELRLVLGPAECEVFGPKCVRIGERIISAGRPLDQREGKEATPGYWFRRPFKADPESWLAGQWVEDFREYDGE